MMRPVAITGMGVVVRDAIGVPAFAEWVMQGGGSPECPVHLDTSPFRAKKAYAVAPEVVRTALAKLLRRNGLSDIGQCDLDCAGHGLLAAAEALEMARLPSELRARCGIALATTSGGMMDRFDDALRAEDAASGTAAVALPSAAAAILSRVIGLHGPIASFSCACSSSPAAFSYALSRLRAGDAPIMLAGGSDRIRAADFAGFNALRAMDRERCRPFDANRKGMVIGDGAAMLVLEDEDHAHARGAQPLGRLVETGLALDAHHITHPNPQGLARAMRQALAKAGLQPDDIGYVNCHGTGTPVNDRVEAAALASIFTDRARRPLISSTKGATGHLLGTAGAIEALITVLALGAGAAPAMASTEMPEETGFEMPGTDGPRAFEGRYAMSNSLGFGGINGSLIFEAGR